MAKDALGHGSNSRGEGGGMKNKGYKVGSRASNLAAQRALAKPLSDEQKAEISHYMKAAGLSDEAVARAIGQGSPKSEPVPTHDSMVNSGSKFGPFDSPELRSFAAKYGSPRDHAAEQRSFNRGAREIARLKKQGK